MATLGGVKQLNPTFAIPDFDTNKYFLFSNVENITKDDGIEILQTNWEEVVTFSRLGVFLTLYVNPKH